MNRTDLESAIGNRLRLSPTTPHQPMNLKSSLQVEEINWQERKPWTIAPTYFTPDADIFPLKLGATRNLGIFLRMYFF